MFKFDSSNAVETLVMVATTGQLVPVVGTAAVSLEGVAIAGAAIFGGQLLKAIADENKKARGDSLKKAENELDKELSEDASKIKEEIGKATEETSKFSESGDFTKYLEQLDNLSENKVKHIIEGSKNLGHDHKWEKLVKNKDWDSIKKIICNVMENGTEYPCGSANCKVMQINEFEVEVRYKILLNGECRISDAFVR